MELCLALGMTLTELCERMPATELALWRAKWARFPWGDRREDERHAMRLHAFASVHGKRDRKFSLSDFYPFKNSQQVDSSGLLREFSKAGNVIVKGSS